MKGVLVTGGAGYIGSHDSGARLDAVMHFAAWLSVGDSVRNPARYYHNNVAGAMSVLDAMIFEDIYVIVETAWRRRASHPQGYRKATA